MKNLTMAAILAAAAMASESVWAQVIVPDDLYLGFENQAGGGKADYIINLGPASGIVGGTTVVNLGSDFSLTKFNSTGSGGLEGSDANIIQGGVVGGQSGSSAILYLTEQRTGGAGIPSVPGSSTPPVTSKTVDNSAYNDLTASQNWPASGTGFLDTAIDWENYVEPTFTANSFYGACGINPDSTITTNAVAYEDLWATTNSSLTSAKPFVYQGYFTFNFTNNTSSLTFTPWAAPAPFGPPNIISVTVAGTAVTIVSSNADPTHHYQLQYAGKLVSTTNYWQNIGSSVTAVSTLVTNSDTLTSTNRFYRVMAQ